MPFAREAFETLGEVAVLEGRSIGPDDVRDADILAIRSTTKVDAALLDGSSVQFVGTATIGTDHLDADYLARRGIPWCYAPGCNANSVSEYLAAALLCLANRHGFALAGKTVGVVGVGNVGSLVVRKCEALGMTVLLNDPPRARAEGDALPFVALDEVLARADVITLHVPLTAAGRDATAGLAGPSFFSKLKPGAIFINAARGGLLDTAALLGAREDGVVAHALIDTWPGEPSYELELLNAVDMATPHIAGHSFEGKVMGTVMVYREACRSLGREPDWSVDALLPPPLVPEVTVHAAGRPDEEVLWEIVRRVYDIEADDERLRAYDGNPDQRAKHFDALRKNYPVRREFRFTSVRLRDGSGSLCTKVARLGFGMENTG